MDNLVPFTPVNFFQLSIDCHYIAPQPDGAFALNLKNYHKFLLPDTSVLTSENSFAKIAMAWNEEGIEVLALVDQPFKASSYPQLDRGDSLELCIDTRNVKTSGYNTRFCHHFFCQAESIEGGKAGEITRFRTEDSHELCKPNELKGKTTLKEDSYILQFLIPTQCLFGYDPEQFGWIGFTYRLNRCEGASQHFSVRSGDYQFEQQPSLWSNVRLIR